MTIFGSGHQVVTGITLPAAPIDGQVVYETDTKKIMNWNGSSWVEVMKSGLTPAGGGLTGTYPNPTVAVVPSGALPAGSVVQAQRYGWGNVTTMSGATWTTCNGSSYTFTPIYATSKLFVFSDIAVHAYFGGGTYAGMSTRLLWRGAVISTQSAVAGHEHYIHTGGGNPDLYLRSAKNATATAGAGAGAFTTQIMGYASTSVIEVNQANQWASGYTILEVKQ
jgi:hypothetical protein